MLNRIDNKIRRQISSDWLSYFPNLKAIKPLKIFQVYDCFLFGIELDILRGNDEYRIYIKLVSLFNLPGRINFDNYILSKFIRDNKNMQFDIPIVHHNTLHKEALIATKLQLPFEFSDTISKQIIISEIENSSNSRFPSIIELPYKEYEFLIQFAAVYMEKEASSLIFKKYIEKLKELPERRMNHFVGNKDQWLNKLINEYENPKLLQSYVQENLRINNLINFPKSHIL